MTKSAILKGVRSQYFFINILNVTTGTSRENLKESQFEVIIQHNHDFLLPTLFSIFIAYTAISSCVMTDAKKHH